MWHTICEEQLIQESKLSKHLATQYAVKQIKNSRMEAILHVAVCSI